MLEILKDPFLKNLSSIEHGFFTRQGGVSQGMYASLNTSFASQDAKENVRENRRRITSYFVLPYEALVSVNNVHGADVVIVDNPWPEHESPMGDAMVTTQQNVILGTDTADCPCVLFADNTAGVVGLCHAGWKGAKKGIVANTINHMIQLGATTDNLYAAISPCIAQSSYEISNDFYQSFISDDEMNRVLFKPSPNPHHFLFDLRQYIINQLQKFNLKSVSASSIDTYSDESRFFSYRRTTHRKEADFGGHFSCVYIKSINTL